MPPLCGEHERGLPELGNVRLKSPEASQVAIWMNCDLPHARVLRGSLQQIRLSQRCQQRNTARHGRPRRVS
jgi:hypothetical protein